MTRTGAAATRRSTCPDGSAHASVVSVVALPIRTLPLQIRAVISAAASSGRAAGHTAAAGAGCAGAAEDATTATIDEASAIGRAAASRCLQLSAGQSNKAETTTVDGATVAACFRPSELPSKYIDEGHPRRKKSCVIGPRTKGRVV